MGNTGLEHLFDNWTGVGKVKMVKFQLFNTDRIQFPFVCLTLVTTFDPLSWEQRWFQLGIFKIVQRVANIDEGWNFL